MVVNTMTLPDTVNYPVEQDDEYRQLQQVANGDNNAFNALYAHYHPRLSRFTNRLLSDPALVEEVVSDSLYAVWKGAGKFRGKSKVSTWIFGISYRTAMKAVRSNARHTRVTDSCEDISMLMDTSAGNDPAVLTEIGDDTRQILAALVTLNPEQRAVVELTAFGWSCAEIGEIVGCPTNTVKTRMFNARKKLTKLNPSRQSDNATE